MSVEFPRSPIPHPFRAGRRALGMACLLAVALSARADQVTTIDGQTLEGIIREENKFHLTLDVRGIIIPIPRERIKEITRATLDENVRNLLDRALEARSRDELNTARTLIEQARGLNSNNAELVENLRQQDRELNDLERRGGTPEARRARAQVLLQRADEAYDKVRIDEGNNFLLQSLRTDPTFEEAHRRMAQRLTSVKDVDLELAAEYFVDAVYPDQMNSDNPVLPLLPGVYVELTNRFDQSLDVPRSQRYAELLKKIYEAIQAHPELAAKASPEARELLQEPVEKLLTTRVENNLKRGNAEFGLRKLQGWSDPSASAEMALLYTRAYVGANEFSEASNVLKTATASFPDDPKLQAHANALDLMVRAETAQKLGNDTEAEADYQQVFDARASLAAEVAEAVGQRLADLKFKQLEAVGNAQAAAPAGQAAANQPPYFLADIAAHVLRYGTSRDQQRRAAEVLVTQVPRVPWALNLKIYVNGTNVDFDPALKQVAEQSLAKPFNVAFDDKSPFKLDLNISFSAQETSVTQIATALTAGGAGLSQPFIVPSIGFVVQCGHAGLGTMINQSWRETALPPSLEARRQAAGIQPAPGVPPAFAILQNAQSLTTFVQQDLPDYMLVHLGLLNSRLEIARVKELIGPTAQR